MGAVVKGNTKATEIIFDRVTKAIELDEYDYPNDVVFVAADLPDFGIVMRGALKKEQPIIVVFPDGSERLIPAPAALS
ncbi:MAG TPA: hypothetical protein VH275_11010 [Solirubrobacterales bacterium]|jgi:hypothetical protein|nr:hypothetical protein [Solirubrobacterales bacterium]